MTAVSVTSYTSFIGRRALLADVREHLAGARVVTLIGPGGVGKSRVALRIADEARRTYPDGSWSVSLSELSDPALLVPTIAQELGVTIPQRAERLEALTDYLAHRSGLLVLDNVEHLLASVGTLVEEMRAACPDLRFLLTSRRPLGLSGEDVIIVPPMTLPETPETGSASPDGLVHYEAVNLFVDRARSANSEFDLTAHNADAVAGLCRELDGLPLAIELAAARTRLLSPHEIRTNLTERFRILSGGFRDAVDRHQSLRACVEWSFELCTETERKLWTRSAVFSGGFDLRAAEAVCAGDDLPAAEVLDLLAALLDQSIVAAHQAEPGYTRFHMLADIRQFGREQAEKDGELDGLRERHSTWCAELAATFCANAVGPDQPGRLSRLHYEQANLREALERSTRLSWSAETGLAIMSNLELFWSAAGLLDEARHWFDIALETGAGTAAQRASAMATAARLAVLQNDRICAKHLVDRAAHEAAGDARANGLLLIPAAMLAVWEGDRAEAVEHADRAAKILHEAADLRGELLALFVAGVCYGFRGDSATAITRHELCITKANQAGERYMRALAVAGLGEQALSAGDLDRADALFRESIRLKRELRDRMGIAVGLDSLGRTATAQGNGGRAALLLGAAERIWDTVGMSETGNPFAFAPTRSDGIQQTRRLLGKHGFREQFRRGSQLGLDDAVKLALGDTDRIDTPPPAHADGLASSPLTKRESEVAELVADGLSNPEIAARLVVSVRTAQGHVENILRKLGFHKRQMVAAWVTERRLAEQGQRRAATAPRP